jgi:hypothetical protein
LSAICKALHLLSQTQQKNRPPLRCEDDKYCIIYRILAIFKLTAILTPCQITPVSQNRLHNKTAFCRITTIRLKQQNSSKYYCYYATQGSTAKKLNYPSRFLISLVRGQNAKEEAPRQNAKIMNWVAGRPYTKCALISGRRSGRQGARIPKPRVSHRRHFRRRKRTNRPSSASGRLLQSRERGGAVSRGGSSTRCLGAQSVVGHAGRAVAACEPEWSR